MNFFFNCPLRQGSCYPTRNLPTSKDDSFFVLGTAKEDLVTIKVADLTMVMAQLASLTQKIDEQERKIKKLEDFVHQVKEIAFAENLKSVLSLGRSSGIFK